MLENLVSSRRSDLSSVMNRKVALSTSYFFFSGNTIHYTITPTTSKSAAALFMPNAILRPLFDICTQYAWIQLVVLAVVIHKPTLHAC